MNEIFEIYNSKAIKTNYKDKHEKPNKEEKALQYVKSITNLNLLDSVNLIENTNPYEYSYQIRTDYEVTNKKRKKLIEEEKVHNTFGAIKDKKSINKAETMIQRHIMLSDQYNDIIGKPLYFELVPNKEKPGERKIDLVTYKKEDNTLNLIELKKCTYIRNYNSGDSSNSTELFIRAALEISTHYSFFIHALENDKAKQEIKKALEEVGGLSIDLDTVEIRKAILAPFSFYQCYEEEIEQLKDHYNCYVIELNDEYDDLRDYKVYNPDKKLFKISRL